MAGLAYRALHQEMRRPGLLDAAAVILLEAERYAEIRGFMERHDRSPDIATLSHTLCGLIGRRLSAKYASAAILVRARTFLGEQCLDRRS
jgi:hypothetical protein